MIQVKSDNGKLLYSVRYSVFITTGTEDQLAYVCLLSSVIYDRGNLIGELSLFILRHFIRVCAVRFHKIDIQRKKYIFFHLGEGGGAQYIKWTIQTLLYAALRLIRKNFFLYIIFIIFVNLSYLFQITLCHILPFSKTG